MSDRAIVLFAHGARDPHWAQPFRRIKHLLETRQPAVAVELAFLEIMRPSLDDAVASLVIAGCSSITIAPLFMGRGGHLKNDLPKIIEAIRVRHAGIQLELLPAIGDVEPILEAIAAWLVGAVTH